MSQNFNIISNSNNKQEPIIHADALTKLEHNIMKLLT